MSGHAERARQWVHAGSGVFALLLRTLTWQQAAALAVVALGFNVLVLPHIGGRRLYRPADEARGYPLGIVLYPVAVLALILVFRTRLDIAAAAWGVLAFGDGAATLVGTKGTKDTKDTKGTKGTKGAPRVVLPWNRDKSYAGTAAFIVFGGAAAVVLALWVRPALTPMPPLAFAIAAPLAAAIVAAGVETIPIRLDDNISVPVAAGAVLWIATFITASSVAASMPFILATLPWAIAVNAVVSWLGYRARTVTLSGMLGGALVGLIIFAAGGWRAWAFLFIAFLVATITSRFGLQRKVLLGIAEERGGRRGAGNAFANCGVAAVAAIAAVTTPYAAGAWLAFTAALTAGASDTVASEIGKAWGRSTFLVTSFGRVKPGTPGAMSLEGTAAGVVAALTLAAVASALGFISGALTVAVVVAATAGAFVESVLGATLEGPGILNNDMLNFINTAEAALIAIALA